MNCATIAVLLTTFTFQPQSFDDAAKKAEVNHRPLVVVIGAKWCPACEVMKNQVIPELAKQGGLENVEFALIDYDEQKELARQLMQGSQIPQTIRFTFDGKQWQAQRRHGMQSSEALLTFINGDVK